MIGDLTEPKMRHEAIGLFYFLSSVGMLLGPTIASFILIMPQTTLRNIYQIVTIIQLALLIYLTVAIKETKPKTRKSEQIKYRTAVASLLRQKSFQSILLMSFLYFFSYSIILTFVPAYSIINLHLSNAEIASMTIYRSLAVMAIRFLTPYIVKQISVNPLLTLALALGGTASLAPLATNNYMSVVLLMLTSGLSFGAFQNLTVAIVSNFSSSENRGTANSLYYIMVGIGGLSKIFTTPIVDKMGFNPVFILGSLSAFASILPFLFYRKRIKL